MSFLLLLFLAWNDYEVIRVFPTTAQEEQGDFALVSPIMIKLHHDYLYVLDQGEHGVHVFDLQGNYQSFFGGEGDGPGQMNWPHYLTTSPEMIYIADGASWIHSFDTNHQFLGRKRMPEFPAAFEWMEEGFFVLPLPGRAPHTYAVYDQHWSRRDTIEDHLVTPYDNHRYTNFMKLVADDEMIYAVQEYGTAFRIFGLNGELTGKGDFGVTPLDDPEFREKEKEVYPTFSNLAVIQNHFISAYHGKGKITFLCFDTKGNLTKRNLFEARYLDVGRNEVLYPRSLAARL
jgi:hypothetical protein